MGAPYCHHCGGGSCDILACNCGHMYHEKDCDRDNCRYDKPVPAREILRKADEDDEEVESLENA